MHLWKIVNTIHKNHLEKQTVISAPLNSAPSMVKPIVKLLAKQKRVCLAKSFRKYVKWGKKKGIQVSTVFTIELKAGR